MTTDGTRRPALDPSRDLTSDPTTGVPAGFRSWRPDRPVAVHATLVSMRRGGGDPTYRVVGTGPGAVVWRATRCPSGRPGLLALTARPALGEVHARAWGPAADWLLAGVPELLGQADDPGGFEPAAEHPLLVSAHRAAPGWRVPRSRDVVSAAVAAALEQVVTGVEAHRAWRRLVLRFGDAAPGPAGTPGGPAAGMRVPPTAAQWAAIPSWEWLAAGVEQRRSATAIRLAHAATGLARSLDLEPGAADRALRSLPGVGVWTSAEIRQRSHGHADAFSFGDYHVARNVSWALTGTVMDDDGCAEIIERYRGHRYRVQRLLELAGHRRPRRAARMTLPSHTPSATRGRS